MAEQDKEGSAAGGSEKCRKCEPEPKTSTDSIDHKTARFIADAAALCSASVIVFEHPDRNGSKAQRKKAASPESAAVQRIVAGKAHRAGVRNTSPLLSIAPAEQSGTKPVTSCVRSQDEGAQGGEADRGLLPRQARQAWTLRVL